MVTVLRLVTMLTVKISVLYYVNSQCPGHPHPVGEKYFADDRYWAVKQCSPLGIMGARAAVSGLSSSHFSIVFTGPHILCVIIIISSVLF